MQQFFKWAAEEEEIEPNPIARMKPPIVPEGSVPVLRESEIKALYKICEGRDFLARRDMAMIRTGLDTGCQLAELAGITMDRIDIDLREILATGTGRRTRSVVVGHKAAVALDRYLRVMAQHRHADADGLWLAEKGGPMTPEGVYQAIKRRGEQIGIKLNPHMFVAASSVRQSFSLVISPSDQPPQASSSQARVLEGGRRACLTSRSIAQASATGPMCPSLSGLITARIVWICPSSTSSVKA